MIATFLLFVEVLITVRTISLASSVVIYSPEGEPILSHLLLPSHLTVLKNARHGLGTGDKNQSSIRVCCNRGLGGFFPVMRSNAQ